MENPFKHGLTEAQVERGMKLHPETLAAIRQMLANSSEKDKERFKALLKDIFTPVRGAQVEPKKIQTAMFELVRNGGQTKFWLFLKNNLDLVMEYAPAVAQGIRSKEIEGLDDIEPEDLSWEIFNKYLSVRKKVEARQLHEKNFRASDIPQLEDLMRIVARETRESNLDLTEAEQLPNALGLMLLLKSQRINEGNNGAIFLVENSQLDESLKSKAVETGLVRENEANSAMKILKVYAHTAGKQEADNQKKAGEILKQAAAAGQNVARVPEILWESELKLGQGTIHDMIQKTTGLDRVGSELNAIAMEHIRGQDLATYIWKEFAKALHKLMAEHGLPLEPNADQGVDGMQTFFEIQEYVRSLQSSFGRRSALGPYLLDYLDRMPATPKEQTREANLNRGNAKKIQTLLLKTGFTLDPKIYLALKNSIQAFREAGFAYLDAHERNVMLTPDNEVVLVDFAKFKNAGRPIAGDADSAAFHSLEDNPNGLPLDTSVVSFLEPFVPIAQRRKLKNKTADK